jgi:murein L,D-transpeptidase YcbB/YkuD
LPTQLGSRHIRVNIADFRVEAWENSRVVISMKAIVGKEYRRTPVFSGEMSYLVFNPYWEVPASIAVKDKLPLFRKDPGAVKRGGFEVLSSSGGNAKVLNPYGINWKSVSASAFPYRLRQRPGAKNALGRVKLMFPNAFNVYLHDTPDRQLFDKDLRAFSSGCIRLQKPLELALWVLSGQPGWNLQKIDAILASEETRTVHVSPSVPVHIEYWTAWVSEDGNAHFRSDIYGRDDSVARVLQKSRL